MNQTIHSEQATEQPPNAGAISIFLSYARPDEPRVKELYQHLKNTGFQPWLDLFDLIPGQKWEPAIRQAIAETNFFLACLSNSSISKRGYAQAELKTAIEIFREFPEGEIFLIPVRLEECPVPESLKGIQWVDLYSPDGFDKLCQAICSRKEKEANNLTSKSTPISPSPTGSPSPGAISLEFENRDFEFAEIRNPGTPALMVIDAPPGYGKSRLLEHVEEWYKHQENTDWVCARIGLDRESCLDNTAQVLDQIALPLGVGPIENGEAQVLIEKLVERKKNVVLLFDSIEGNRSVVEWLQKEVVTPLRSAFQQTVLLVRVVFAGRYLSNSQWEWRGYRIVPLTVFEDDIVRQAVLKQLERTRLRDETKETVASEIAHLSSGHPGIMEALLMNPPNGGWASAIASGQLKPEIRKQLFHKHAEPVIERILDKTDDQDLGKVLTILSVFRRFNVNTIQTLQTLAQNPSLLAAEQSDSESELQSLLAPFLTVQMEPMSVLRRLVGSGLVSGPTPTKPYYHDSIIRQLMLTKLQMEDGQDRLYKLNLLAQRIYALWFDNRTIEGNPLPYSVADEAQIAYAIESLYHLSSFLLIKPISNVEAEVSSTVDWHAARLRSSFGYSSMWLLRTLRDTVHQDNEVMEGFRKLVAEAGAKRIFGGRIADAE
ncbi:MAG: TIR domain-containing protein [Anaerolineae bacterium]